MFLKFVQLTTITNYQLYGIYIDKICHSADIKFLIVDFFCFQLLIRWYLQNNINSKKYEGGLLGEDKEHYYNYIRIVIDAN